jgi:MYXO-CTERM domain-containing protein
VASGHFDAHAPRFNRKKLKMRNNLLVGLSSALAAVAVAGSASAAMTFDSFTVAQSESNLPGPLPGINWASPASSQPIFGASGTRAAFAYNYGNGGTTTSSVSGGTATFTTTTSGGAGAGLYYSGDAQDLTGYTFSFYLDSTVPTDGQIGFVWEMESAGGGYIPYTVNYTGVGTYTIDLSTLAALDPTAIDLTAITSIAISIYTDRPGSATVSDFTYTAVPAPGAVALLGVAGLAARRRRA